MKKSFYIYILSLFFIFLTGCSEEYDISQFDALKSNGNITGDTVYIQISPSWNDFNKPEDMYIGKEPFIYVADTYNDRVVMMNLAGTVLSTRTIKHPTAIAQDYRLNLYVCAQFDTLINGATKTYSAVYRLDQYAAQNNIAVAPITMLLPRAADLGRPDRIYTGVTCFYDNSVYVARTGPQNTSFIDPDNSILMFNKVKDSNGIDGKDSLVGRVALLEPTGTGLVSANGISSINSFARKNFDMVLTYNSNNSFKVQWLTYVSNAEKNGYESKLSPTNAAMMLPGRFSSPEGSCVDYSGNIFVADAGKDSIFKFNAFGEKLESIGGYENGASLLKSPHAVQFFDNTVYVLDTEHNCIKRFVLSTDLR